VTSYVVAQDIITMGYSVFAITHAFLERFYVPILAVVQYYLSKSAFILWFVEVRTSRFQILIEPLGLHGNRRNLDGLGSGEHST